MLIKLKNYGINPANNIRSSTLFFNHSESETSKNQISICHFFEDDFYCFNPLPHLAEFNIKSDQELFQTVLDYALVKYLLLDVSYNDRQLKRKFTDRFVWLINTDGRLMEVPKDSYSFLKKFSCNKKELKKSSRVHQ